MQYEAKNVDEYISQIPAERQSAMQKLREVILENMPEGIEETIGYKMPAYVIPKSIYPSGYHCKPFPPLPFVNIASQKNYIAFYHMGIYMDEDLMAWFKAEFAKVSSKKLDMGKSCIRFKKPEDIPFELMGELMRKMRIEDYIAAYERTIKK